jgi:subtilisin family serine protease
MTGKVRRTGRAQCRLAVRLERLETRALPSGGSRWGSAASPIDPARSVMVGIAPGAAPAALQAAVSAVRGWVAESFPDGTDVVTLLPGVDRSAAIRRLTADPAVAFAEPDSVLQAVGMVRTMAVLAPRGLGFLHPAQYHSGRHAGQPPMLSILQTGGIPNDPKFPLQWGLNNPDNIDINAPQAWSITIGSPGVIVAVLDTGLDLRSPEFADRLWTNPRAGRDGYVGDLHGWNFVDNNGSLQDVNGHGTHVTGILAATGNNGYGIAGVDWNAQIMPLKMLGSNGMGSLDGAVSAILFAANHGARIINASWGGNAFSPAMQGAIGYAANKGCVFVTAAGNDSLSNDFATGEYPANYRLPNELSVAAIDASGNLANFSDYGAHTVDVGAPGVNVFSTIPGGYATYSGTSMATAFVSGVVSLLAGQHPELSASDLVQRIDATAKPVPSLASTTISGGMVDAYNALTDTLSPRASGTS